MKLLTELTLITVIVAASCFDPIPRVRYDNYAVYNLAEQADKYSIWYHGATEIHIMVSPIQIQKFVEMMSIEKFIVELLIPNVQVLISK